MTFDDRLNRWWRTPERNAAGRLGLIRIMYAYVMVVGLIPPSTFPELANMPKNLWFPLPILIWLDAPPPAWSLHLINGLWLVSLMFLLFGFRTRTMTLVALISGILTTAVSFSFSKIDHGGTFMYIFFPSVMLFSRWGDTYSIDALLRNTPPPLNSNSGLRYGWPFKALLIIVAVMFMVSGLLKGLMGQWIVDPEILSKFLKEMNLENPQRLRFDIYQIAIIPFLLQWASLVLETFFPLALINFLWRRFFLASIVFFHTGIKVVMGISFTGMVQFYAIYLDFQAILNRILPAKMVQPLPRPISKRVQSGALLVMFAVVGLAFIAHYDRAVYDSTFAIINRPYFLMMRYFWEIAVVIASGVMLSVVLKVWENYKIWRQKTQQKSVPEVQANTLAEETA